MFSKRVQSSMISGGGLDLVIDGDSSVEVSPAAKFLKSAISIKGNGNVIEIGNCRWIEGLNIRIVGDGKLVRIGASSKKIKNLKITSHRGSNQRVIIGKEFGCGGLEVQMNDGDESVIIGDDCLFSWGIKMRTSDGHALIDLETGRAFNLPRDIVIGNHVWIGEDCRFLKGSGVANNSVVGMASVVTKIFSRENVVIGGFPASELRSGVTWNRMRAIEYNDSIYR